MLLNHGELEGVRVLAPATVDLMTANHLPPRLLTGQFQFFGIMMEPRARRRLQRPHRSQALASVKCTGARRPVRVRDHDQLPNCARYRLTGNSDWRRARYDRGVEGQRGESNAIRCTFPVFKNASIGEARQVVSAGQCRFSLRTPRNDGTDGSG
jgi:hypothetical protein